MREEDREEDLGAALAALRAAATLTQAEVARAAGLPASSISEYEGGRKVPSGRTLERIVSGMALPPSLLETALGFARLVRASKGGDRSMADAAARLGSVTAKLARSALELCAPPLPNLEERAPRPAEEDRLHAPVLWERLRRYGARERRAIVQEAMEFRSWALCELLCEESVKAADGTEGIELAGLALWIAGLLPGDERWRSRVEGYAWAFLGKARSVQGDLPGAREAFARSAELRQTRGSDRPDLLDESRLLALGPPILGE